MLINWGSEIWEVYKGHSSSLLLNELGRFKKLEVAKTAWWGHLTGPLLYSWEGLKCPDGFLTHVSDIRAKIAGHHSFSIWFLHIATQISLQQHDSRGAGGRGAGGKGGVACLYDLLLTYFPESKHLENPGGSCKAFSVLGLEVPNITSVVFFWSTK